MSIAIKILNHDDIHILEKVDPDVFDDAIDFRRASEFLADPCHHLGVAMDSDRVVGFVSGVHYVHPDKPNPELWINEIGVAETYRRQGIGKRLINAVFDVARDLGCAEAWVLTERENIAAMRLYSAVDNPEPPSDCIMFSFKLKLTNYQERSEKDARVGN